MNLSRESVSHLARADIEEKEEEKITDFCENFAENEVVPGTSRGERVSHSELTTPPSDY